MIDETAQIAKLAAAYLKRSGDVPMEIRVAALRSAASILENEISRQSSIAVHAAIIRNIVK